jgi:hypothetical protein
VEPYDWHVDHDECPMRRLLIDADSGQPVPPMQGATYAVHHTEYRLADDGNEEADILIVYTQGPAIFTPLSRLPIWGVR